MLFIGIAGGSGSGKTTFSHKLNKTLNKEITILSMDSYYLSKINQKFFTNKDNPNFDHPEAFDWILLRDHLFQLKNNNPIKVPVYDFKTNSRTENTTTIYPSEVIILEGIFSLYDQKIRDLLDIKCFLSVDSDIRFIRRLHRDVKVRGRTTESIIEQYYDSVRPMYLKYLDPQKQFADFVVGEETDVAAEILSSRLREEFTKNDSVTYQNNETQQHSSH